MCSFVLVGARGGGCLIRRVFFHLRQQHLLSSNPVFAKANSLRDFCHKTYASLILHTFPFMVCIRRIIAHFNRLCENDGEFHLVHGIGQWDAYHADYTPDRPCITQHWRKAPETALPNIDWTFSRMYFNSDAMVMRSLCDI